MQYSEGGVIQYRGGGVYYAREGLGDSPPTTISLDLFRLYDSEEGLGVIGLRIHLQQERIQYSEGGVFITQPW